MNGRHLIQANSFHIPLADNSVNMVATSPPFWGLRDYSIEGQLGKEKRPDCLGWATGQPCGECFVCHLVIVFREVWRVLHPTGVAWLNLGDSYARDAGKGEKFRGGRLGADLNGARAGVPKMDIPNGLKPKDLVMIPARVALALQADGWWVRQNIIWAKGNAMPESVTDRCCNSHEYVLLLAKNERYFFDHIAVREPAAGQGMSGLQEGVAAFRVLQKQSTKGWANGELPILYGDSEKGLGSQIQPERESQAERKTLLLLRERAGGKENLSPVSSVDPRTKRPLPNCKPAEGERPPLQGASYQVLEVTEGEGDKGQKGQAVSANRGGEVCKAQNGNKAQVSNKDNGLQIDERGVAGNKREVWTRLRLLQEGNGASGNGSCDTSVEGGETHSSEHSTGLPDLQREEREQDAATRNARSVWFVNTTSYPGAHFATWPPALVEPMIKAGSSEFGVCPSCRSPWKRITRKGKAKQRPDNPNAVLPYTAASGLTNGLGATTLHMVREVETVGWQPTCKCPEHTPVPAVILDPFSGSGTTVMVARQLGRVGIGLDLNFAYLSEQGKERTGLAQEERFINGRTDTRDYSNLFSQESP